MNDLDRTFAALADPTRRGVIELLRKKPLRAGEIASSLDMTGPERCVRIDRDERVRVYRLRPEPFNALQHWSRGGSVVHAIAARVSAADSCTSNRVKPDD